MQKIQLPVLLFSISMVLTSCGEKNSSEPVFQKAEGYTCVESAIAKEYLVQYRDGEIEVVHYASDEEFLKEFFEPNKDLIKSAEPNYRISVADYQKISTQYHDRNTQKDNWGAKNIRADQFWKQNEYGNGILISVIDTGVDINHTQLKDRIYKNPGEHGLDANGNDKRTNGIDDDGNGYIDDHSGYDFFNERTLLSDNGDHGTHVTGIIAATHSSKTAGASTLVQGVAPRATILPASFLGPNGSGTIDGAIKAIRYSVERGAKIINASWGGQGCSIVLRDEVRGLQARNILFVSAAGNRASNLDTWPEYPASFEGLSQITVGSIDANLKMSDFSNFSDRFVHIFAPGGGIISTTPGSRYATFSGTSMATPFISGAAALIWSKNPHFSAIDVRNEILRLIQTDPGYINQTKGRFQF